MYPGGGSVVGPGDGPESFLAGGIPDLKFDILIVDRNHASAEFDADGHFVFLPKSFIDEL